MEYNIALAIYHNPPTPQHQLAAIGGLTSTRDPALIQQSAGMLMGGQVAEQNMTMFLHVSRAYFSFSRPTLTLLPRCRDSLPILSRVDWSGSSSPAHGLCWRFSSRDPSTLERLLNSLSSRMSNSLASPSVR